MIKKLTLLFAALLIASLSQATITVSPVARTSTTLTINISVPTNDPPVSGFWINILDANSVPLGQYAVFGPPPLLCSSHGYIPSGGNETLVVGVDNSSECDSLYPPGVIQCGTRYKLNCEAMDFMHYSNQIQMMTDVCE